MNDQLKKAIELSKKTGDRLMVYDVNESHDPYIVMTIDDYEKMVLGKNFVENDNLTDDELTDKINRDIADWKDGQTLDKDEFSKDDNEQNDELTYDYKKETKEDRNDGLGKSENWSIPRSRKGNV